MDKIITLLSRHKSFLLAFNALLLALTLGKLAFSPREWVSEAQIIFPNSTGNLDADLETSGLSENESINSSETLNFLQAQESILLSSPLMTEVFDSDPEPEKFPRLQKYERLFKVAIAEQYNTLDLKVIGSDSEIANQRAENWIDAYQQRLQEPPQTNLQNREIFIEPPSVSSPPSIPNKKAILASWLLVAALGSTAIIFLREGKKQLLKPKDLASNQFGIVVCIPQFKPTTTPFELPYSVRTEFAKLASALSQQELEDRRLLIVSSLSGEGKTMAIIGLARALADLGYRVLTIDADNRRSELTKSFGFSVNEKQDYPYIVYDNIDLFRILPYEGKVTASKIEDYFEEQIMAAEAMGKYDFVLIDSSPISLAKETIGISSRIKNTLFVVRPTISKRDIVKSSLNQLKHHEAQPLGLIVNEVQTKNPQLEDTGDSHLKSVPELQEKNLSVNNQNGKGKVVIRKWLTDKTL